MCVCVCVWCAVAWLKLQTSDDAVVASHFIRIQNESDEFTTIFIESMNQLNEIWFQWYVMLFKVPNFGASDLLNVINCALEIELECNGTHLAQAKGSPIWISIQFLTMYKQSWRAAATFCHCHFAEYLLWI